MDKKLIYVVDDEKNIRDLIKAYLDKEGYRSEIFDCGEKVLKAFNINKPDMLIIDIMMPGIDGFELCKRIRKESEVPIIIVSAKDEEIDRILGLELGSDDYLAKPFSPRELMIRVKNIFKRIDKVRHINIEENINFKDITIKPKERAIYKDKMLIDFTNKEYELLNYFLRNINQALSREQIIDKIWGYNYIGETRPVDDLIKRIRKKLKKSGSRLEISTVWGYGYKIDSNL